MKINNLLSKCKCLENVVIIVIVLVLSGIFKNVTEMIYNVLNQEYVKYLLIVIILLLVNYGMNLLALFILVLYIEATRNKIEKLVIHKKKDIITDEQDLESFKVSEEVDGYNTTKTNGLDPVATFKDELNAQGINKVMGFDNLTRGAEL